MSLRKCLKKDFQRLSGPSFSFLAEANPRSFPCLGAGLTLSKAFLTLSKLFLKATNDSVMRNLPSKSMSVLYLSSESFFLRPNWSLYLRNISLLLLVLSTVKKENRWVLFLLPGVSYSWRPCACSSPHNDQLSCVRVKFPALQIFTKFLIL